MTSEHPFSEIPFRKLPVETLGFVLISVDVASVSNIYVSRSGWGGGGGLSSLYIKIGYSEPTRAESQEGTSGLVESSLG